MMTYLKTILFVWGILCFAADPQACTPKEKSFPCVKFIKNYDGDTLTVNIPGVHPLLGKKIRIRVNGIDTPEIRGRSVCEKKKARLAKRLAYSLLSKAKRIDLLNVKRGKYFRIVADVFIDEKKNLAQVLLKNKLAYKYKGKRKPKINWCKF